MTYSQHWALYAAAFLCGTLLAWAVVHFYWPGAWWHFFLGGCVNGAVNSPLAPWRFQRTRAGR